MSWAPAARLRRWWAPHQVAVTEALVVLVSARVALSVVAVLAVAMLPEQRGQHEVYHRSQNVWLDVWARWDSEYYLNIAQYGYSMRRALLAFYPLYPLLISTLAPLLGHDYVLSGVVVSSAASLAALVYLFKLIAWDFGEELARRTVLYVAVYPTALFLMAVYTESLFLTVTVAALYHARRGQWSRAALAAFLAAVTRPTGFAVAFPLAYEVWRQTGGSLSGVRAAFPSRLIGPLAAVAAAPLGFVIWQLYLVWFTQDPLAAINIQQMPPFQRSPAAPPVTLARAFQFLSVERLPALLRAVDSIDLAAAVVLIQASVVAWWRLPAAYAIYLSVSTLLLLSSTHALWPLQSMSRYSLVIFPLFVVLAQLGAQPRWHRAIVISSAAQLGMHMALFATWYWVL